MSFYASPLWLTGISWSLISLPSFAQTITAAPDGTGTIVEYQGQTYQISGGTQAAANLFHSFEQFGLTAGEIAQFLSQPGIENILARVTGGDPSVINGELQVTGSNANLYLMNPAGIVFGPNARLDVPASFTATTGDRIGFEGGWFNSTGPNNYQDLTGHPQQFSFLQDQPAAIINGGDLTTTGDVQLLGGTVVNTGTIAGDHVTLAAVPGSSRVKLSQPGMLLSLEVEQDQLKAGIAAVDLPKLLTGSGVDFPLDVVQGEVAITNKIQGQTVDLMAAHRVSPLDPQLIYTGSEHAPTVVLFPEDLAQPWAVNMIDFRADQPYDLLYGGKAGTISRLILPDEAGISAINQTLERVAQPIDELNIIAEGHQGNIWLGKTWLHGDNIGDHQTALGQWGTHLSPGAALLIYSCFTALGAVGEEFVNALADVTGLTVAASTNATGSANYGGDWQLEYRTGDLDILNPFTAATLNNWQGKLAAHTVINLADTGAGSLRELVGNAAAGDSILFGVSGTIGLTTGAINITVNDLTIDGVGQNVVINGNNNDRIFRVDPNLDLTLNNLTLTQGAVSGGQNGGAILTQGTNTLTLNQVTIENSSANTLLLNSHGGAIYGDRLILNNSNILNNTASDQGGGIFANTLIATNSTIANNTASVGGGIFLTGTGDITNSTLSGNEATALLLGGSGGGLFGMNTSNVTIQNSTIANNRATALLSTGGGLFLGANNTTITNSIIASNTAIFGSDISGSFAAGTFEANLITNTGGITGATFATSLTGVNPLLGPLQNNGGPTLTHALLEGSPAINAGNNALTTVTVDQRGQLRIFEDQVDIGSYEFQIPPPPVEPPVEQPVEPLPIVEIPPEPLPIFEPSTPSLQGDLLQNCPPYCQVKDPNSLLNFDDFLEAKFEGRSQLDPGIEEIESNFNQAYADYLGLDEIPTVTLAEAQANLQTIAAQTGQNPAILYITFVPTEVESTGTLLASANLQLFAPELAQRVRAVQGERDELQLVLVTAQGPPILKRVGVHRAKAIAEASRFNRAIASPRNTNYLPSAQKLYDWLITPIKAELQFHQVDHIGIIADMGLRFVPFAALHDGDRFLIQQYSLGLMPSLSLTDQTYQSVQGLPVLAMGASEFPHHSPLPAVPLELQLITEAIASGEKALNEDFTATQLRRLRAESGYRIVHLGTHGEFNPGSPAESYIELWGDRLTLDRVRELGLQTPPVELLVLSACRTALGSHEAELGFAGFAVQAGVKSVLGSLWHVSDAGTLGLMSAFYQKLQSAPIKAQALREAQLAMIRGEIYLDGSHLISGSKRTGLPKELALLGDVKLHHPYYWSAFTMIGSPW
ncbi:MAG: CHAT domain-containing protein [Spirulina sp. DLM2.Bin59]|nr:MAG: CHAT domain-containing protein [Spirulina sp. DLM2.Bin59]